MNIVFLCEDPKCPYPDYEEVYPVDDNIPCECGKTKWGHHTNKKREVK